ncbi:NAD-dependent epimerase/dehydratase family protein [Accumulibacter sp.]|uniref:NAD-dependent epimerase/dehydratase family protein n=1 Tax=Accumulibacter sp. TaxID=2053492 RepID=UPI0025EEA97B|nr:NAD-dependent epimerase/dehydratase family protein [Accumulibacter sp.]MCM8612268.1 NAD-dependent epimerase/dehydratase family protein [Accumulibacter sp.]MCM8635941.1 NAD-dependent epimerase/dehydratase family protein [Accumulibacter sp.]MCM8639450.1 NAD-dependent epimerase/dehydratase family protein [Accumulibacter sp.]
MRILITGGAGFIGSHTAAVLVRRGHAVRILDCLDPQIHGPGAAFPAHLRDLGIELLHGDVSCLDTVSTALHGVDAVYHLAALTGVGQSMYDMRSYVATNNGGTATLIEAIIRTGARLRRLVVASSRAVYGEGTHRCREHGLQLAPPRTRSDLENGLFDVRCPLCGQPMHSVATAEERVLMPVSLYAWTKRHQEDYGQYAAQVFGLPVTILRYFNVFGSRQSLTNPYTGIVSIFYNRLALGLPISLYEHGQPGRDFVHVSDVARANWLALEADVEPGTAINIGTGSECRVVDVAQALAKACGTTATLLDTAEFRVGDIHSCFADLERATTLLGYVPQVDLDAGMQEFVAWARLQTGSDGYDRTVAELARFGLFGKPGKES